MNSLDLKERTVVVTGGARGLGFAVAQRALESGASVALWDVDAARLEGSTRDLGRLGKVSSVVVELTDEASVQAATAATLAAHGAIDALVNSAGITGGNAPTWELTTEAWRRVIDVNLTGSFLTCRAVVPHMLTRGRGRIVNIASVAGKEGNPNAAHYSASKAGLIGLTKSLGKELAERNICVNAVTPAAAKTEIFASMSPQHIEYMLSKIPMKRFLMPEEAAALIVWLCTDECSFSTGAVFDLSGGRATY
ncbi:SDR family NAD(P)-dependent oxidoreductase [Thiomonas sp.]|jgi:3-oxoacyl-[acyl-carrier protein] reductase|uniref:SDR family NAD(P)-dependent oxidoreductase n=1 Tax=Thiomonas sp. TaxID=2047785 RepID=UPI002626DA91|nr:SDR family NAD(P)-dependent oxidoreductase [Thiomonas sp.]